MSILSVLSLIPTLVELSPNARDVLHEVRPPCVVAGCSGELCVDAGQEGASNCLWKQEFQCYKDLGICEQNASGACGWRQTPLLQVCLVEARGDKMKIKYNVPIKEKDTEHGHTY